MARNISFTIKYWKQNGPQDQGHFDTHEMKNIPDELIPIAHHWLILHGRYVCQARTPKCETCGLQLMCKYYCEKYKVSKDTPKRKNK